MAGADVRHVEIKLMAPTAKVIFIGPLPPPVHGFSNINALMLEQLARVAPVSVFNRSPNIRIGHRRLRQLVMLVTTAGQVVRFIVALLHGRTSAVYTGFSGRFGQLLDLPFIALARVRHVPIYLHHHSFAYMNVRSRVTSLCVWAAGSEAQHIVLCSSMAELLASQYRVAKGRISQLSNSGFMPTNRAVAVTAPREHGAVRVGFLGNISAEKGIFKFIDVIKLARTSGLDIEAVVAGPVTKSLKSRFFESLEQVAGISYLGGVYGEDKRRFFESIDILLFPTEYVNEAEPVTIWEALAAGVEVIANRRGCIADVIAAGCGDCAAAGEFEGKAIVAIKNKLEMSSFERSRQRAHIRDTFLTSQSKSQGYLDRLISQIASAKATLVD